MNNVNYWNPAALIGYILVLIGHFFYAAWLIRTGKVDLRLGFAQKPAQILSSLIVLNGVSLTAFAWPHPTWVTLNFGLHVLLTFDEVVRTRKAPLRWPFILNHVLFAATLWFGFTATR